MQKNNRFIRALIHFARLDGTISLEEKAFIQNLAQGLGANLDEFNSIWDAEESQPNEDEFSVLENYFLFDTLIQLMLADGIAHEAEIGYAQKIAAKLGFDSAIVNQLIEVHQEKKTGNAKPFQVKSQSDSILLKSLFN